jgi:hypothetical protein
MGKLGISTLVSAVLCLLGCSRAPPPTVAPAPVSAPALGSDPPPAKTVLEPLARDVERARAVQHTIDANADDTRHAVDTEERGDNPP